MRTRSAPPNAEPSRLAAADCERRSARDITLGPAAAAAARRGDLSTPPAAGASPPRPNRVGGSGALRPAAIGWGAAEPYMRRRAPPIALARKTIYAPKEASRTTALSERGLLGCGRLCGQRLSAWRRLWSEKRGVPRPSGCSWCGGSRPCGLAERASDVTQRCGPLASTHVMSHDFAWRSPSTAEATRGRAHSRVTHSCAFATTPVPSSAASDPRPRGAPSTVQWRSPVSMNERRASLHECAPSPHERIRPPAWTATSPGACLAPLFRGFVSPACASPVSSPTT
jgi:hypothetical protein